MKGGKVNPKSISLKVETAVKEWRREKNASSLLTHSVVQNACR